MNTKQLFQDAYDKHCHDPQMPEYCKKIMSEVDICDVNRELTEKETIKMKLLELIFSIPFIEMYLKGENEDNFKVIGDTLYMVNQCHSGDAIKIASIRDIENIDVCINDYMNC